ncbi:MAG: winged helix-turn-helix domain-containing protein [Saprospiraceae bacterium]|nr:winged helix-turn-helix domain-containing protein [Saprospiraceae bacterium]MCF8252096.1 winged helix-turn-helix domain-containing protein [Saprospiraceae bacterium]MCF8282453.1 winged helix-turn-helix domain-containing protein [Bacteroidales bacterium]MCF8313739.1 winged helix-turn-helix domain-containing protein [Saprospiraceae bacterium]MCF8442453.1 winged helix-turn-helix domain-containing protein [Saprospiraceae bacterium]
MKNHFVKIGLPLVVLLSGLLAVQGMGWMGKPDPTDDRQFAQKVNLAMRQAADRLFDITGDSTSTIPPVEQVSSGEYLLRLENNFKYDSLPYLLEAALAQYGIEEKYYVSVNDCLNNLLLLGYSQESLKEGEAACLGRDQKAGCYNLSVVFPDRIKKTGRNGWAWAVLLFLLLGFAAAYYYKNLKDKPLQVSRALGEAPGSSFLGFGNCNFDPANQFVQIGDLRQPLTFREAKLLHFFVQNQNLVLERDTILAAVWEDEGIIVGRSLDVFVSRLRKILQKDPTVKIANVHGVGYRLEVGL